MIIEDKNTKSKTTLDDDAAIYAKRDTRPAKAKFKDLQGKAKWQFFCDYMLGKLIAVLLSLALIISLLYSFLKPKPEVMYYLGIIDSTLAEEHTDALKATLMDAFVTDSDHQTVTLDADYYVSTDAYSARSKLMTLIGAGEIDAFILPENELIGYSSSGMFGDLNSRLTKEELDACSDRLVYGSDLMAKWAPSDTEQPNADEVHADLVYGIDVTGYLTELTGYEPGRRYMLACMVNSPHADGFETMYNIIKEGPAN